MYTVEDGGARRESVAKCIPCVLVLQAHDGELEKEGADARLGGDEAADRVAAGLDDGVGGHGLNAVYHSNGRSDSSERIGRVYRASDWTRIPVR